MSFHGFVSICSPAEQDGLSCHLTSSQRRVAGLDLRMVGHAFRKQVSCTWIVLQMSGPYLYMHPSAESEFHCSYFCFETFLSFFSALSTFQT